MKTPSFLLVLHFFSFLFLISDASKSPKHKQSKSAESHHGHRHHFHHGHRHLSPILQHPSKGKRSHHLPQDEHIRIHHPKQHSHLKNHHPQTHHHLKKHYHTQHSHLKKHHEKNHEHLKEHHPKQHEHLKKHHSKSSSSESSEKNRKHSNHNHSKNMHLKKHKHIKIHHPKQHYHLKKHHPQVHHHLKKHYKTQHSHLKKHHEKNHHRLKTHHPKEHEHLKKHHSKISSSSSESKSEEKKAKKLHSKYSSEVTFKRRPYFQAGKTLGKSLYAFLAALSNAEEKYLEDISSTATFLLRSFWGRFVRVYKTLAHVPQLLFLDFTSQMQAAFKVLLNHMEGLNLKEKKSLYEMIIWLRKNPADEKPVEKSSQIVDFWPGIASSFAHYYQNGYSAIYQNIINPNGTFK